MVEINAFEINIFGWGGRLLTMATCLPNTLTNVFHMQAGYISELDTPPTLVNLNVFILTKTPLN